MVKKIKKSGCNVLLIQKSILRDAVNDLSLHFLAKLKIMVVKDIERDEIEFICKSTGCKPIADIDSFTEDKLGYADLIDEVQSSGSRVVKVTGVKHAGKTVSILCHGANSLVLEEAERSLHDALCVIRCLVKKKYLIAGGGAPEIEVSLRLQEYAKTLRGMEAHCFQAFAEALEVIPITLAENAGLNPIAIVTELRNRHALGETTAGINVRKGAITNILDENVIQPLLVSTSAIELAAETVKMLLKIDDLVRVFVVVASIAHNERMRGRAEKSFFTNRSIFLLLVTLGPNTINPLHPTNRPTYPLFSSFFSPLNICFCIWIRHCCSCCFDDEGALLQGVEACFEHVKRIDG
jgi:T-complex protein 1 subunit delta